jgi:hypothetical protein
MIRLIILNICILLCKAVQSGTPDTGYTDKCSYRAGEWITFYLSGDPPSPDSLILLPVDGSAAYVIPGWGNMTNQSVSNIHPWADGYGYSPTKTWQVPSTLKSGRYTLGNFAGTQGLISPIIIKGVDYPCTSD